MASNVKRRSPTQFQIFRSLQSDYGKYLNAVGKQARPSGTKAGQAVREQKDKEGK